MKCFVLHRQLNILFKALPPKVLIIMDVYTGNKIIIRKTGREPGRFDQVPCDVPCVVLCVVLIIELLPTHSDSKYCLIALQNAKTSLLLELWMLPGLMDHSCHSCSL